jgi:uncharacterized membrane protein
LIWDLGFGAWDLGFDGALALLSAACYGAADFVGGLTSRRASTIAVVLVSQFSGFVLLTIALAWLPAASPTSSDLLWGAIAGLAGSVGVGLLYAALAIGTMAVVAPVTAVCAVAIPVIVGVVLGEALTAPRTVGIVLAMFAIVLVSQQPGSVGDAARREQQRAWLPPGVPHALASGLGIGLFFLALARTGASAGVWPLLLARGAAVVFFAAAALMNRSAFRLPAAACAAAAGAGALDVSANVLYLLATRVGPLSSVVTLASLYPASTIVLARVVLGERLGWLQVGGIACAFVAVVLIVRV